MRINWNYIKIMMLLLVITGLYAFSGHRNNQRKISEFKIEFSDEQNLYIDWETVNKLLIHSYGPLTNLVKEDIALNTIEDTIEANEMVKSAQVYLTVSGELTSKIVQRQPVGRVEGKTKFYIDDEGKYMPLSNLFSARVPIITGKITGNSLEDVYAIIKYINADEFLRKNIIGIHIEENDKYQLRFRMEDFVVNLGAVDNLEMKFENFKAFYGKATKDKTLSAYNTVNLEFDNQVVCTKI